MMVRSLLPLFLFGSLRKFTQSDEGRDPDLWSNATENAFGRRAWSNKADMLIESMSTEELRAHAKRLQEQLEHYYANIVHLQGQLQHYQREHRTLVGARHQQHAFNRVQFNQSIDLSRKNGRASASQRYGRGPFSTRSRGMPRVMPPVMLPVSGQCNVTLIRQTSKRDRCVPNRSFRCVNASLRVFYGCRGLFRCGKWGRVFLCGHFASKTAACACANATAFHSATQWRSADVKEGGSANVRGGNPVDISDALAAEKVANTMFRDMEQGIMQAWRSVKSLMDGGSVRKGNSKDNVKVKAGAEANGSPDGETQSTIEDVASRLEDELRHGAAAASAGGRKARARQEEIAEEASR